jgi:hypothetical protein
MDGTPMTGIEQIRLEARLLAIENILAGLVGDLNRRYGVSFEQFAAAAEEMQQQLGQQLVIPTSDSVISGFVAAEVAQAISALLKKIADYTALVSHSGNESPSNH